jgi:hypothetical protein
MRALVALLSLLAGCPQVLGLDNTTFEPQDGGVDAPSVCDGAPACTSSTGRSVCGQLFATGDAAGPPLRVANPTGAACVAGNTEGPCALAVGGMAMASLFDTTQTGRIEGVVDDCGRFVVADLDTTLADVAIVFTGTDFHPTATLVLGRELAAGEDRDVTALAVTTATTAAWSMQLSPADPPIETGTGYLVEYTRSDRPVLDTQVAKDNSSGLTNPAGTIPWAAYFGGGGPFGTLDPALTATGETGTALAVLGGGIFSLEGVRTGARCKIAGLQQVGNTLIHVIAVNC